MKRAIGILAVIGSVLTIARPAVAGPLSCTLTNRGVGEVTVNLGGFGDDNVYGVVSDAHGVPVQGAAVDIVNRDNDQAGDDESGVRGAYDIDLDAEKGHVVDVFVTWTDSKGVKREVQGTCTL